MGPGCGRESEWYHSILPITVSITSLRQPQRKYGTYHTIVKSTVKANGDIRKRNLLLFVVFIAIIVLFFVISHQVRDHAAVVRGTKVLIGHSREECNVEGTRGGCIVCCVREDACSWRVNTVLPSHADSKLYVFGSLLSTASPSSVTSSTTTLGPIIRNSMRFTCQL